MVTFKYFLFFLKVLLGKLSAMGRFFGRVLWRLSKLLLFLSMVWLLVAVVTISPWPPNKFTTPNPMVCGRISGVVYELPRKYVIYWPEYEGESSWEPGFVNNKKGCGANLVSLYMAMSWPEMQPVPYGEATSFSFGGLTVAVEPWVHGATGLKKRLKSYLRATPITAVEQATYEPSIGMTYVEGVSRVFPEDKQDFFWLEKDGRMQYIVYCVRAYDEYNSYCDLKFVLSGGDALVSVKFLRGKLGEWRSMVNRVEEFLKRSVRQGEGK